MVEVVALLGTGKILSHIAHFEGISINMGFPGGISVKNLPANAGDIGDLGSISGSGRSPGGGNGNSFPYSCLEKPTDRGAWGATVHGVTENRT